MRSSRRYRLSWLLVVSMALAAGLSGCDNPDSASSDHPALFTSPDDIVPAGLEEWSPLDLSSDSAVEPPNATAGVEPVFSSTATAVGLLGETYVATVYGDTLVLFTIRDNWLARQTLTRPAADPSLAVDAMGRLHLTYYDEERSTLYYALKSGNQWYREPILIEPEYRSHALALDSAGRPRLCLTTYQDPPLNYVFRAEGSWHKQTVRPDGSAESCDLAMDAEDRPQIAAVEGDIAPFALLRHWQTAKGWTHETVYEGKAFQSLDNFRIHHAQIAVDRSGDLHIACLVEVWYLMVGLDWAFYGRYDGSTWRKGMVSQLEVNTPDLSLVLDRNDKPHLFCGHYNLLHIYKSAVFFHQEEIDSIGGSFVTAAAGPDGLLHAAHVTFYQDFLRYAVGRTGEWKTFELMRAADAGRTP